VQNIADKGAKLAFIYEFVYFSFVSTCSNQVPLRSNGAGFTSIKVDGFNATMIQAADGEFVRFQID
jgi:hypothetical protein